MKRLLTSCFGLGRLPVAPGTWGSLPPMIVFGLLVQFGASTLAISIVMAAFILAGSVVCVMFAPAAIEATGRKDPREVIADEIAGQAVTYLAILFMTLQQPSLGQTFALAVPGFVLFRLFDITKPYPIRKLEKLPSGWGILADDILAGVYAAVCFWFYYRYLNPWS